MADNDQIRSLLLSSHNTRVETIEIELGGNVVKVGVKQPSMGTSGKLLSSLRKAWKSEDPEQLRAAEIECAIACAVNPDNNTLLFNERDKAGLKEQPSSGWISKICEACLPLMYGPTQKTCRELVERDGKQVACGGELMSRAPFCPWCGANVPHPSEVAEKNS